jgi:exodeoxyribonuclease VII small subunit
MKAKEPAAPTFEEALAELDRVVHDLEDGHIGLEAALDRYEKGVGLLRHCYALVNQAEQKIQVLTGLDDKGQPVLKPFAAE